MLLIGDAGDSRDNAPTLEALGRWGNAHPGRTTVLFLGDNLYPQGLHEDDPPSRTIRLVVRDPIGRATLQAEAAVYAGVEPRGG